MNRDNNLDVRIQYHSPDGCFAAVFLRDGEPWFLDGALVGMGSTRDQAVKDLYEIACHIVTEGSNFLTDGDVAVVDRIWLFDKLDWGDSDDAMYQAIRSIGVVR